jgi:5'-3' exonuclease
VLFGDAAQSTNKDVLDAMAGAGNRMADLLLQYRQARRDLKRAQKQVENKASGIHVDDFHRAPPPSPTTVSRTNPSSDSSSEMLEFDDANGSNPLLLVDASAYIFRAYYSMPPLHRADGMPVGAVLGFCNMLNRLVLNRSLSGDQPRIVLVFDSKGKNFRHEMYPDYKANRGPCPEDLVPQFDLIREAATAYGIDQIEAPAFEADDVIATLATMAREEGINVHVLSGDKDLMQLVTPPGEEPSINMIDPKEMIRVTYDVVVDKFGVPPALLGDVLALAGDKSDNIPGVPGIGPKIASTLINEYGSLGVLLERAGEIKQKARREKLLSNTEEAVLSRKLVELDKAVPLEVMTMPDHYESISELKMAPLSSEALFKFYEEMGFYDLTMRLKRRLGISGSDVGSESNDGNTNSSSKEGSANTSIGRVDSAPLNDNIRQGLIMHQMRKSAPPKPEDFDDVPF